MVKILGFLIYLNGSPIAWGKNGYFLLQWGLKSGRMETK